MLENVLEIPQRPDFAQHQILKNVFFHQLDSLTAFSPPPPAQATSPAATQTTPLRRQLAAEELAARGSARRLGPRSVHRGSVPMTPKPVNSTSTMDMPGVLLIGALIASTSAE